jgi:hypothetical protein
MLSAIEWSDKKSANSAHACAWFLDYTNLKKARVVSLAGWTLQKLVGDHSQKNQRLSPSGLHYEELWSFMVEAAGQGEWEHDLASRRSLPASSLKSAAQHLTQEGTTLATMWTRGHLDHIKRAAVSLHRRLAESIDQDLRSSISGTGWLASLEYKSRQTVANLRDLAARARQVADSQEAQLSGSVNKFNRIASELGIMCRNIPPRYAMYLCLLATAMLSLLGFVVADKWLVPAWPVWAAAILFPVLAALVLGWKWFRLVQAINQRFGAGIELLTRVIAPANLEAAMQVAIADVFESTATSLESRVKQLENGRVDLQQRIKNLRNEENDALQSARTNYSRFIRSAFGECQLPRLSPMAEEEDALLECSRKPSLRSENLWDGCTSDNIVKEIMVEAEKLAQSVSHWKVSDCIIPEVIVAELEGRWWINQARVPAGYHPGQAVVGFVNAPPGTLGAGIPYTPENTETSSALIATQVVPEAVPVLRNTCQWHAGKFKEY